MTDEELRECARSALLGHAMSLDDIEVPDVVFDETGVQLEEHELATVMRLLDGATVVVMLGDELAGTQDATPGPWRVQQRYDQPSGAVGYASVHPEGARRMIASTVGGTPAFCIADARLIVALRNAYRAATNPVPTDDSTEKENRS